MFKKHHIDLLLAILGKAQDFFTDGAPAVFTEADWFEFLSVARAYGVAPILYKQLTSGRFQKEIPGWLLKKLGVLYVSDAKRQMAFRSEFSRILERLNKDGISFIVLKGPYLAEYVYRDWALRPMNDLDILLKQQDMAKAVSTMEDMGYSNRDSINKWGYQHHLPPFVKEGFAPIEIHFEMVTVNRIPCRIDHDSIWQRTQSVKIGDAKVPVLSLEDLLLHLCLHICQHEYLVRPIHIYDIAALIREYEERIDWAALRNRAHQWEATKALYLTLAVTHDLTGTTIPEKVMNDLKPVGFNEGFTHAAGVRVLGLQGDVRPNLMDVLEGNGVRTKMKLFYEKKLSRKAVSAKYPLDKKPWLICYFYGLHILTLLTRFFKFALQVCLQGKERTIQRQQTARSMHKWLTGT